MPITNRMSGGSPVQNTDAEARQRARDRAADAYAPHETVIIGASSLYSWSPARRQKYKLAQQNARQAISK